MILKKLSERFDIARKKLEKLKNKVLRSIVKAESKYWIPRVVEQEAEFTRDAETCAQLLSRPVQSAASELCENARKIYGSFKSAFGLSDSEAKKLLKDASPDMRMIDTLKKIADTLPEGEEKRRIQAEISAPAYKHRIEQTERMLKENDELLDSLARNEIKTDSDFLRKQAEKALKNEAENDADAREAVKGAVCDVIDAPKGIIDDAVDKAFKTEDTGLTANERVNKILNTDWSGRHFSDRVWGNTEKLSRELRNIMLHMELTGDSYQKTTVMIQERYDVRAYEARRLLRTETNYIINQVELDRMKERGIEEYRIEAVIDERTSDICREEDGKVYKVADAVVGANCPPFHPFCRSRAYRYFGMPQAEETTDDIFENMNYDDLDKWLKDNNMTWDEWVDKQIAGKTGDNSGIAEQGAENSSEGVDKFDNRGIIEVGKEEMTENDMLILSSKFMNPNDDLYRYADRITPEEGFGDIICHGDPDNLLIRGMSGEEWEYPAEEAADMIRNSREFKGEPIRLIACQTGAKENGIAQKLADTLGVEVKAPTESVYINMRGEMFITDNDILARLWDKGEDVEETGEWKIFTPRKR